jgi:quinol-cytochrome oxidoreductase complex cytochrome b subunit
MKNKVKVNYWVDILLLVSFFIVGISGFILLLVYTSGEPGVGRSISFLGMNKNSFMPWHTISGIVMVVLSLIHFIMHWNWFKAIQKNIFK